MLTRLNLETRSLHQEVDSVWVELLAGETRPDEYESALLATYGFEAPVEAAVAMTRGVGAVLPLRARSRMGLLVQDLLELGYTPAGVARLPQCCQIVPFRDVPEALGWQYVVERATLLHDSVRRHLEKVLPRNRALNYLMAFDGHHSMRWQELGTALDHVATTDDIEDQIIAAVRDAFATQRHWLVNEAARVSA